MNPVLISSTLFRPPPPAPPPPASSTPAASAAAAAVAVAVRLDAVPPVDADAATAVPFRFLIRSLIRQGRVAIVTSLDPPAAAVEETVEEGDWNVVIIEAEGEDAPDTAGTAAEAAAAAERARFMLVEKGGAPPPPPPCCLGGAEGVRNREEEEARPDPAEVDGAPRRAVVLLLVLDAMVLLPPR